MELNFKNVDIEKRSSNKNTSFKIFYIALTNLKI